MAAAWIAGNRRPSGLMSALVIDQERRERRAGSRRHAGRSVGRRRRGRERVLQRLQELLQDVVGRCRARGSIVTGGRPVRRRWTVGGRAAGAMRTAMATCTVGERGLEDALKFGG